MDLKTGVFYIQEDKQHKVKNYEGNVLNRDVSTVRIKPQIIAIDEEKGIKTTLYYKFNKRQNLYYPTICNTRLKRKTRADKGSTRTQMKTRKDKGKPRGEQKVENRKTRSDKGKPRGEQKVENRKERSDKGQTRGRQTVINRKTRSDKQAQIKLLQKGKSIRTFNCYYKKYEDPSLFESKKEILRNHMTKNKIDDQSLRDIQTFLMKNPSIDEKNTQLILELL